MAKLDRLGWAAGISFRAYGLRVGIRVSDARILERLAGSLPYGWKPIEPSAVDHLYSLVVGGEDESRIKRFNVLYSDAGRIARSLDLGEVLETLESSLRLLVAEHARTKVFVHAGVVGWNGHAIVIPGSSYSGKSTLVSELVRAGATYYSDEYAVLDARGRVHPFVKPLSIREGEDGRQTHMPIETIGGVSGTKPLPVGCVLVTRYRPGAPWRPRPLSPGRAMLSLLAHTVPARNKPRAVFDVLPKVTSEARSFESARVEAREVVRSVLSLLPG